MMYFLVVLNWIFLNLFIFKYFNNKNIYMFFGGNGGPLYFSFEWFTLIYLLLSDYSVKSSILSKFGHRWGLCFKYGE